MWRMVKKLVLQCQKWKDFGEENKMNKNDTNSDYDDRDSNKEEP